jgi:ketosteroid isomerase-like protein
MSYSISTLQTRNLHEVFGENDAALRRAAIDEIFTEDCVFYDPMGGVYRGREEIDSMVWAYGEPTSDLKDLGNGDFEFTMMHYFLDKDGSS